MTRHLSARRTRLKTGGLVIAFLLAGQVATGAARAADFTAREVTGALFKAKPGRSPSLAGKDLARLDLSNLDFKGADLNGANLFGADLSGANLDGANLNGAVLDRATVVGAHFDNADLEGASLLRVSAFTTLTPAAGEAPSFRNAKLRGAKIFGRFSLGDLSGVDLTDAVAGPANRTGFIEHIWRTEFSGAKLTGAVLTRANLTRALLTFADCRGAILKNTILQEADLSGADLTDTDLSGADLTNADLTDADLTRANLDGANLHGARGLDRVRGMALARNAGKIIH